jgi:MFS family permease
VATVTLTEWRWYSGISGYQWLALGLASLGWVFDVFEGQIFVACMNEATPALLGGSATLGEVGFWNHVALGAFLLGGALGGILFGMLGDRIGRQRTMTYTILLYSLCTALSAFAPSMWWMAGFRFLAAMGVGGEWAVASTLVAEEFPRRSRAWTLSLFQASGCLGKCLAAGAGALLVAHPSIAIPLPLGSGTLEVPGWRLAFLLGAAPALMIILVRRHLREPEVWLQAVAVGTDRPAPAGRLRELFAAGLRRRTLVGVGLAAVGMATFWGTVIYAKDALRDARAHEHLAALPEGADAAARATVFDEQAADLKHYEMLGMFLATLGSGLGLVCFGPMAEWLGRRGALLLYLLGGLAASVVLFQVLAGVGAITLFLPVFGFLTTGIGAGCAVYFPELFPTRLRGTGAGFCFNAGRVLAAPALFAAGWLQMGWGLSLTGSATLISVLFPLGALLLLFAPETRGCELLD